MADAAAAIAARAIQQKCQPKVIPRSVSSTTDHWCEATSNNAALKKSVAAIRGQKTMTDGAFMRLLGVLDMPYIYRKLGIKADGKTEAQLREELWAYKQTGEYDKVFTKQLKLLANPNRNCLMLTDQLPDSKHLNGYVATRVLGSGAFGTVLLMQKRRQVRAVKLIRDNPKRQYVSGLGEANMQQIAHVYGLAPAVHGVEKYVDRRGHLCYMITMDVISHTLSDQLECIEAAFHDDEAARHAAFDQILAGLRGLILKLKEHNMTHADASVDNIALDKKNRLVFIDFGQVSMTTFYPELVIARLLSSMRFKSSPETIEYFTHALNVLLWNLRGEEEYEPITYTSKWRELSTEVEDEIPGVEEEDLPRIYRRALRSERRKRRGRSKKRSK